MSKSFQLIVPPIVETELTGFSGGIEKQYRGALYRIEIYPSGLSCTRDGVKIRSWDDVPASVQRALAQGRTMLAEAAALRK